MQPTETVSFLSFLQGLIASEAFWGIMGVFLGLIGGEGIRAYRGWTRTRRLKNTVREELRAIRSQIPDKIDILNKMIQHLDRGQLLAGTSVRAMNRVYVEHIDSIYEELTPLQRNCLHVIHEKLRNADQFMEKFEELFVTAAQTNIMDNPRAGFRGRCDDMIGNYKTVIDLIDSYIGDKPVDVFHTGG